MIKESEVKLLLDLFKNGADITIKDGERLANECLRLRNVIRDIINHQKIVSGEMANMSAIYNIAVSGLGE